MSTDRVREEFRDDLHALVDATSNWDSLGEGLVTKITVVEGVDPLTGASVPPREGFWDPLCLRWHELGGRVASGSPDRRMAITIVNDYEGPYADPLASEAPFGQLESITARNRSTRERDLEGRTAIPASHRRVIDSEDGRYAIALTARRLEDSSDAPAGPPEPLDDPTQPLDPSEIPEGVRFLGPDTGGEENALGAVSFSTQAVAIGGLTVFGRGATNIVKKALKRGIRSLDELRKLALDAATGKNPKLPEATRERGAKAANEGGAIQPRNHPSGYVYFGDVDKIGVLGSVWDVSLSDRHWFVGSEFTPIGPLIQRHDSLFGMPVAEGEPKKVGALRFAPNDASEVTKGSERTFKGELWWDPTAKGENSNQGGVEQGKWVPVITIDYPAANDIPPPPPPPEDPPPEGEEAITVGGGRFEFWHQTTLTLDRYLEKTIREINETVVELEDCCKDGIKIGGDPVISFPPTECIPVTVGSTIPVIGDNPNVQDQTIIKAGSDGKLYSIGKQGVTELGGGGGGSGETIPAGTTEGAILIWDGSAWTESTEITVDDSGGVTYIGGKLDVAGGIDPTYLQLTPQASAPFTTASTLWALTSDGTPQWHDGTNNYEILTTNSGAQLNAANVFAPTSGNNSFNVTTVSASSMTTVLDLIRNTSGTATDGLGGRIMFSIEDALGSNTNVGYLSWDWSDESASEVGLDLLTSSGWGLSIDETASTWTIKDSSNQEKVGFDGTNLYLDSTGALNATISGTFTFDSGTTAGADLQGALWKMRGDPLDNLYHSWEIYDAGAVAYEEVLRIEFPSQSPVTDQDVIFYGRADNALTEFMRYDASDETTQVIVEDAFTTAIRYPFRINHETSATPTANFGLGIDAHMTNAAGTVVQAGAIEWVWTDPTATTEDSQFQVRVVRSGSDAVAFVVDGGDAQIACGYDTVPQSDNAYDLGATALRWNTLFLSGDITDGTDTWTLPAGGGSLGGSYPQESVWNSNTQTLTGSLTLTDSSATLQLLDPDGVVRQVNLPTPSTSSPYFAIVNTGNDAGGILRVLSGGATIAILELNSAARFFTDGSTWYSGKFTTNNSAGKRVQPIMFTDGGTTGAHFLNVDGLVGSSSGTAGPRNEKCAIDGGVILYVSGLVGTNTADVQLYKNGAASETIAAESTNTVHETNTSYNAGDRIAIKQTATTQQDEYYCAWFLLDTLTDGYPLSFGHTGAVTTNYFLQNHGNSGGGPQSSSNQTTELVFPEDGGFGAFSYRTQQGDNTTQFGLIVNGSSDQTITLGGQNGTVALTASSFTAGDDVALQYTGGTNPGSISGGGSYEIGTNGDGALNILSFGGDTNGANGEYLDRQVSSLFSPLSSTLSGRQQYLITAEYVTDSFSYRTEDTTQSTWKLWKNGAVSDTFSKSAANTQGSGSLTGSVLQLGDEIAVEIDANEASDSSVLITLV